MRTLAIIVVAFGIYAGWELFQKDRQQKVAAAWASECAKIIESQARGTPNSVSPGLADEGAFFKTMHFLHKADVAGYSVGEVAGAACDQLGIGGEVKSLIVSSLSTNYATAKQLRLFEEPFNAVRLEQGLSGMVALAGWEDEPVGVGHLVPPYLAPDLANSLANLILMPVSVRDSQTGSLSLMAMEQARKLERADLLPKPTLDAMVKGQKGAQ